jgi:hypothetical protein
LGGGGGLLTSDRRGPRGPDFGLVAILGQISSETRQLVEDGFGN